jgi:hypothetical protein
MLPEQNRTLLEPVSTKGTWPGIGHVLPPGREAALVQMPLISF